MVAWVTRSQTNYFIISNTNYYKTEAALLWHLVAWALLDSLGPILAYFHKEVWVTITKLQNKASN